MTFLTIGAVKKNKSKINFADNHGHVLRLFDTLTNFLFTTSET